MGSPQLLELEASPQSGEGQGALGVCPGRGSPVQAQGVEVATGIPLPPWSAHLPDSRLHRDPLQGDQTPIPPGYTGSRLTVGTQRVLEVWGAGQQETRADRGGRVLPPDPGSRGRRGAHRKGCSPGGWREQGFPEEEGDRISWLASPTGRACPGLQGPAGQWLPHPPTCPALQGQGHEAGQPQQQSCPFHGVTPQGRGLLSHYLRHFLEPHEGQSGHPGPWPLSHRPPL